MLRTSALALLLLCRATAPARGKTGWGSRSQLVERAVLGTLGRPAATQARALADQHQRVERDVERRLARAVEHADGGVAQLDQVAGLQLEDRLLDREQLLLPVPVLGLQLS